MARNHKPYHKTLEFEVESQIQILSPVLEQFLFLSHKLSYIDPNGVIQNPSQIRHIGE